MTKKFKWIVEIEVDEELVKDKFNLLNNEEGHCELIECMFNNEPPYPNEDAGDLSAKVISAPEAEEIATAQGYKNVNEYYQSITE